MRASPPDENLQEEPLWQQIPGKNFYRRASLFLLFFLTLWLLFQFREQRIETLELGSKSDKYVIAHVDFDYSDADARAAVQREAMLDIGKVSRIKLKQIDDVIDDIQTSWRDEVPLRNIQSRPVKEMLEIARTNLKKTRFTDQRTIDALREYGIDTEWVLPNENPDAATLQIEKTDETSDYWDNLLSAAGEKGSHGAKIRKYLTRRLSTVDWTVQSDPERTDAYRNIAAQQVPTQKKRIEAGQPLIAKNETVTLRHLEMLSAMKQEMSRNKHLFDLFPFLGNLLLALIFTLLGGTYLSVKHSEIFVSVSKMGLLITISILTIALAKGTEYLLINEAHHYWAIVHYPIYVPFASVLISILLGMDIALFITGFLVAILSISLAVDIDRFLVINLVTAVVGIVASRFVHKRRQIYNLFSRMVLSSALVIFTFNLMDNHFWSPTSFQDLLITALFLFALATIIVALLPPIESLFNTMTSMRLIEYLDPSNPLLMRMVKDAKATYSHSLFVANLAESAAAAIGANGLLCRVACYYHDIGKLRSPHFFTENQGTQCQAAGLLTLRELSREIIKHVEDGVQLARRERLPEAIIDFIRSHHGTTRMRLYEMQLAKEGNDKSLVDESEYRYPGPKPQTREQVIVMLADSTEAASRSLDEVNKVTVRALVESIAHEKMEDGQFEESDITFRDLYLVKEALIDEILVERHARIKYPDRL